MTPKEWISDSSRLICLKCGQEITLDDASWYLEWQEGEYLAAQARAKNTHFCQVNLKIAREVMKRYRADNPPMTFEEEVELYQSLIHPT